MTYWKRFTASLKQMTQMVFSRRSWARLLMPRSRFDYEREIGDGLRSSVLMVLVQWMAKTFPEAPIRVRRVVQGGELEPVANHRMMQLIRRPNQFYSGIVLWMATMISFVINGNAYWMKIRNGVNGVLELWYVPHWLIEPAYPDDGSAFISHYDYSPLGYPIRVETDDVVHFRWGLDPHNIRKGLSPVASVMREIFADDEASNYAAALLRNMGVPGLIVTPASGEMPASTEDTQATKQYITDNFTGDQRGKPMAIGSPIEVHQFGFDPKAMNLRELRKIPEERVSGALGIPAIVAGFGAGLDRSTFANMHEAREMAYESGIIPLQRLIAEDLFVQLLPDFESTPANFEVDFDTSDIRVLQEDRNQLIERTDKMVRGGWITVASAKRQVGMEPEPGDDVYLRGMSVMAVPEGQSQPQPIEAEATEVRSRKAITVKQFSEADQQLFRRLQREAEHHTAAFAADLEDAFSSVANAIMDAIEERSKSRVAVGANGHGIKAVEDWPEILQMAVDAREVIEILLPPDPGERYFRPVYERHWQAIAETTYSTVSDRLGVAMAFDLEDPVARDIIRQGGQRVGMVDIQGQTRQALFGALADGREAGDGADALARRIRGYVEGSHMYPGIAESRGDQAARQYRSTTIARTETKYAQNLSSIAGYEKSEVVNDLICFDGDDCGWESHDSLDPANGSIRSFEDARNYPLAHVNCVRNFAPRVQSV